MLKTVLIAAVVVLAALAGFIATRPAEFRIERTTTVSASPDVVQAQLIDFHKWAAWSPWEKLDPNQKTTFSGPESGVGAEYAWAGNDKVGKGKMTITEVRPNEKVTIALSFQEPMAGDSVVEIATRPEGDATQVVWTMSGKNDFFGKAFSLVMDMDAMIGKDFETGLAQLKTVSEAEAKKRADAAAAAQAAEAEAAAQAAEAAPEGDAVAADAVP